MTAAKPLRRRCRQNAGSQENAFRTLLRTMGLVDRVMHPYFARFGISGSQWGVLRTLQRAHLVGQARLRLTDLGNRLIIRPPSVTAAVDRLERTGLVQRQAAPDDARAKLLNLTPRGLHLVEQIQAEHPARIHAVLRGLSGAQQLQLQRLLNRLAGHLQSMLDGNGLHKELN